MIPVVPTLTVRPVTGEDTHAVIGLLNRWLDSAPYSLPLDARSARQELFQDPPYSWFSPRWIDHQRLGAWRAGEMVGFIDLASGHDTDHLDESEYAPHGIVRFLALSARPEVAEEAGHALFDHAEEYWSSHNIVELVAFHHSTGYPSFQAGAGVLPGDWGGTIRLMTGLGWQLARRYYCFSRTLGAPLEEEVPVADLSLTQQRLGQGRTYSVYHRRVEQVAHARVMGVQLDRAGTAARVAHVVEIVVDEAWRNRRLGKWLLRRLINDAALQGFQEMVIFLPMDLPNAMNLFIQQGFREDNYRGYTLTKRMEQV